MSTSKSKQTLRDRYSSQNSGIGSNGKASGQSKGLRIKPVTIIAAVVVGILGVVFVATILKSNNSKQVGSYNLVVTPDNIDELLAENPSKAVAGSYDVSMNSTWHFDDAKSASDNAYVENLLSNSNTVNFTLTRNDTGAVIYESPYIPVGSSLRNIKLSEENMGKGTYPCTVTYYLLDENYEEISSVRISVSVVIRN